MSSSDDLTGAGDLSRGGRKNRSSPFLVLAAGLLVFAAAIGIALLVMRPTTLRIAVGPSGSDDQTLIQALAQSFARDGNSIRLSLVTTAGPLDSIAALRAHKADLAVARGDEEMPDGTESVAILRKNFVVLWAASRKGSGKQAKSKIKGIDDLPGHRVAVVGRTQVNVTLLRVILKESGVDPEKVAITQFNTNQVAEMVRDSSVDAFMTVGPLDSKVTSEAIVATTRARGEPVFLPIDVSEAIASRHPLYESEEIPGSAFSSSPARPDDKIETVAVNHLIVAPKSLSDGTVATFTRQLFAARPSLAKEMPSAAKIEKPDTDKDAALPAHPGAAAYIDGNERTFMDNYSDYIWAAVLLFSVLGSGVAWLRHYVKRDERRLNILHREKLLAAIGLVRQINSIEELDALQCEADEFVRETLECYDDGAIEQGDLAAYSLVLDQFHNAVVDRRAALGATAANLPRMRVG
ncbi:TAXI family TRAP transporter solute-binding subunit [Bradyrhizobium canariense]|uniref:TRAP transporter solute receptor, TAXI family n=1 Tax=Bradyrhizobium canariense TaxID=255045 RepID=A0A1H1ZMP8_9BRAD|nr:TAXI family TRAP transporter solute-binding subunit [Bradyrhizobium canariense]SDT34923.1 TRAP transporter solute receptor, TAXI family [Bradyrhizobium canariense]